MAGKETDSESMVCSEEDEAGIKEWENVGKGKKGKSRKRKKKETSSIEETESEGSEEREKRMREGTMNVVVRFEAEGGIKKIDPINHQRTNWRSKIC